MLKLALLPVLLIASCLIAGAYGALHNQISYTVSPEYFHAFKFQQFRIPEARQDRVGAAMVGFFASWWMGAVIGLPVFLGGLVMPDAETYFKHCLIAIGVVVVTALIVGLSALAVASATITENTFSPHIFPEGVGDRVAFARAGMMHNFSYIGGGLGFMTAAVYLAVVKVWWVQHEPPFKQSDDDVRESLKDL